MEEAILREIKETIAYNWDWYKSLRKGRKDYGFEDFMDCVYGDKDIHTT